MRDSSEKTPEEVDAGWPKAAWIPRIEAVLTSSVFTLLGLLSLPVIAIVSVGVVPRSPLHWLLALPTGLFALLSWAGGDIAFDLLRSPPEDISYARCKGLLCFLISILSFAAAAVLARQIGWG